jgi:hypothetical protein
LILYKKRHPQWRKRRGRAIGVFVVFFVYEVKRIVLVAFWSDLMAGIAKSR